MSDLENSKIEDPSALSGGDANSLVHTSWGWKVQQYEERAEDSPAMG